MFLSVDWLLLPQVTCYWGHFHLCFCYLMHYCNQSCECLYSCITVSFCCCYYYVLVVVVRLHFAVTYNVSCLESAVSEVYYGRSLDTKVSF